jgi:hypothetical protein
MNGPRDKRPSRFHQLLGEAPVPDDVRQRIAAQALQRLTGGAEKKAGTAGSDTSERRTFIPALSRPHRALLGASLGLMLLIIGGLMILGKLDGADRNAKPMQRTALATEQRETAMPDSVANESWESLEHDLPVELGPHRIVLAPQSRMRLRRHHRADVELALESGRARFAVQKLKHGATFRVRTPEVLVEVVGTRFTVTRSRDCTGVSVQSGQVRVARTESEQLLLDAGEQTTHCQTMPAPSSTAAEQTAGETPERAPSSPLAESRSSSEEDLAHALQMIERGQEAQAATLLRRHVSLAPDRARGPSLIAREALFHLTLLEAHRGNDMVARNLAQRYLREVGHTARACRLQRVVLAQPCDSP